MVSFKKRSARIQPIINSEEQKLDKEMLELTNLRQLIDESTLKMQDQQKIYIEGVEKLNQIRASASRENLQSFEEALTFSKDQWYRMYRKVQQLKERETVQVQKMGLIHKRLQSIKKLKEKFDNEVDLEEKRTEQKVLDEVGLRRFVQERDGNK